jgi:hypothetical protein
MKNLLLKKLIPLIIYSLVYLYFMVFNWKVFTLTLQVNLGFGVLQMPPFIVLFLLGVLLIGILSWISYMTSLRKIILELEHGVEVGRIKDRMLRGKLKEHLDNEQNLEILRNRLGIPQIQSQLEDMRKHLDEGRKPGDEGHIR